MRLRGITEGSDDRDRIGFSCQQSTTDVWVGVKVLKARSGKSIGSMVMLRRKISRGGQQRMCRPRTCLSPWFLKPMVLHQDELSESWGHCGDKAVVCPSKPQDVSRPCNCVLFQATGCSKQSLILC